MSDRRSRERSTYAVRKTTLSQQDEDPELANTTAAERLGMMWQLTLDAWAFTGDPVAESRLPRHLVRVLRRRS